MEIKVNHSILKLIIGDITKAETDAIVNAANSGLRGGSGVDEAINREGGPTIQEECKKIIEVLNYLPPGLSVVTHGGLLKAKWVIHTVGPIWADGLEDEDHILRSSYMTSLRLARLILAKSIAFPSISTGAYRFPIERASIIALKAILEFLENNTPIREVNLFLYTNSIYEIYKTSLIYLTT